MSTAVEKKASDVPKAGASDDGEDHEVQSVRVVVRCRPFIKSEASECKDAVHIDEDVNCIAIKDPSMPGFKVRFY